VVGQDLIWDNDGYTMYHVKIIGVAKDFHFTSLRNEIKPFGFLCSEGFQSSFTIKLDPNNLAGTLDQLANKWKQFSFERPFEYFFLDESFAKLYASETRFQKIFIGLVILGIFIACLGLLGLATYAAQQRVKEIGIRKTLGASVTSVVLLLSRDFIRLVVIALVIAIPVAWYAMERWLQDFAYRIDIEWWIFILASIIAIGIAFLTISFQTIKAARANPVPHTTTYPLKPVLPKLFKHSDVFYKCSQKSWLYMIGKPKLFGGRSDNGGNLPVMHMTDIRKQMVFYLEIEAAYKPRQYANPDILIIAARLLHAVRLSGAFCAAFKPGNKAACSWLNKFK
jgi:hypothetical protein